MARTIGGNLKNKTAQIPPELERLASISSKNEPNRLPINPGDIYLRKEEKQLLEKIGHKEGDPIPANLADELDRIRQEMEAEEMILPVPADTPPLKIKEIDISSIPEEKLSSMKKSMEVAKDQASRLQAVRDRANKIIERRRSAAAKAVDVPDTVVEAASFSYLNQKNELPPNMGSVHQMVQQPTPTDTAAEIKKCPHCNWDLAQKDTLEVSKEDRAAYVAAVVGGKRFKKIYSIFGGKMKICFRSLLTKEVDMANRQILVDASKQNTDNSSPALTHHMTNLLGYRTVMALEYVETDNDGKTEITEIFQTEFPDDAFEKPDTPLVAYYPLVVESIMPVDTVRRVMIDTYMNFEALFAKIEMNARNEDFF